MEIDFEKIVDNELKELHWIMDKLIKVPLDVFVENGTSGFFMTAFSIPLDGGIDVPGHDIAEKFREETERFEAMCAATPNASRICLLALSMAYVALSACKDERFVVNTDEGKLQQLLLASESKGFLLSKLPGTEKENSGVLSSYVRRSKFLEPNTVSIEEARSMVARVQANMRHAPSQMAKTLIQAKYRGERERFANKDDAADHYIKDHPYEFVTIRKWLKGI